MCIACDDPIPAELPGDPDTVSQFATTFTATAEALRDAAQSLRAVANENITISLAIDEVRSKADEVIGDTYRVANRYGGAGTTFTNYASALDDALRRGNGARADIIENNESGRYWRHRERDLRFMVQMGNADPEVLADFEEATRRANYADGQFATLIGRYRAAVEARDNAVREAISGLDDAETLAGLNDGFFDGIVGNLQQFWEFVSDHFGPLLEILREVLEALKKIVDVLALIVTVLSIFFPVLGPIALALTALSAILGVAIFVSSLLLFAMGRETLGRVLADGIMAVVGVVTAKLGGVGSFRGALQEGLATFGKGTALFATRGPAVAMGLVPVETYGSAIARAAGDGGIAGTISANATPIAFVVGEGLDFTLGVDPAPWGAEPAPAWSMEGANNLDMLPGLLDSPTFGTASPIAGVVDIFTEHMPAINESAQELGDVWSQFGAVPAA